MTKINYSISFLFFLISTTIGFCQSKAQADSFFYAGNNRLKSKWEYIDTATFNKSIKDYEKAVEIIPEYWQAYRNRARIYAHQKKYEQALVDLTYAIQHADKASYPRLFEMRGQVLYELKMYRDAIDDLHIALKDPQDKAKVLLLSAKSKWKIGNQKGACNDYNAAVLLDKNIEKQKEFIKCEVK